VVREVEPSTFLVQAAGALVVDVREPSEYLAGHVPGAKLLPLAAVPARLGELPNDRLVFVICATGNRSLIAVTWMHRAGIDAWSVNGGTNAWVRAGRPLVTGFRQAATDGAWLRPGRQGPEGWDL
jgi:rhodanese-related sulfurtransferase